MDEDAVKPWTVKGISPEDRNAAIAAAGREHVPIGIWLARAIRAQIQADVNRERGLVVVTTETSPIAAPSTLEQVTQQLDALVGVALKANVEGLSEPVRRLINNTVIHHIRTLRPARARGHAHAGRKTQPDGDPNLEREGRTDPLRDSPTRTARGQRGGHQQSVGRKQPTAHSRKKGV